MIRRTALYLLLSLFPVISFAQANQQIQNIMSNQFRLGDRIIRIAEPGQLADSVNVWGDLASSGRFLVPRGTTLPLLISYGFGPQTLRGETDLDWSKMRVEVNVQEYDEQNRRETIKKFKYRFEDPFPEGMSDFVVENNQTITVRVKRRPSFRDYVGVIAPVISAVATSIIIADRIAN